MALDSRTYTNLQAVARSFGSGPLYRDVARNWRGMALYYLLLVLTISLFLVVANFQRTFYLFLKKEYRGAIDNIPPFQIRDGEVSLEAMQPCEIRNNDTGALIAVIDTTGTIASLDQTDAKFLLTKRKLLTRKEPGPPHERDLSRVKELSMDGPKMKRWIRILHLALPLVIYSTGLMALLAIRLGGAYVAAALGALAAPKLGARLSFPQLIRLAVVAQTPDIVLWTAAELAGIAIPYGFAFDVALSLAFFAFAIRANAGIEPEPPESDWGIGWTLERSGAAPPKKQETQ